MNNPYKVFFPMGLIVAIVGIIPFIINFFLTKKMYPIDFHFRTMIEVFFNLMVAGFALTAIPQFTKTEFLNKKEIFVIALLFIFAQIALAMNVTFVFHALILIFFIIAMSFATIKLITANENPPSSFYLLPVGFCVGAFAEILFLIDALVSFPHLVQTARSMLYFGYYPLLIMGVGIRLIPGILGHSEIVKRQKDHYDHSRSIPKHIYWIASVWLLSLIFFILNKTTIATIILIIWFFALGLGYFKMHKKPLNFTLHTFGIWIALWMMPIALIVKLIFPQDSAHWLHLFFINGLLQLILMITYRVTIAHDKLGFDLEKSKAIAIITFLVQFAGLTRASAHYLPASYQNHLGYAALLLIVAYGLFVKKLSYFRAKP
jgi:uncharacterized protein involved in response to NO